MVIILGELTTTKNIYDQAGDYLKKNIKKI